MVPLCSKCLNRSPHHEVYDFLVGRVMEEMCAVDGQFAEDDLRGRAAKLRPPTPGSKRKVEADTVSGDASSDSEILKLNKLKKGDKEKNGDKKEKKDKEKDKDKKKSHIEKDKKSPKKEKKSL